MPTPLTYTVLVRGHLGSLKAAFAPASCVDLTDGTTAIHCRAADQAALFGVLHTVERFGLVLLAVCCNASQEGTQ